MATISGKTCTTHADIAETMLRYKITESAVARKLGVSRYTIGRWLRDPALDSVRLNVLRQAVTELAEAVLQLHWRVK